MSQDYEFHEIANWLPMMDDEGLQKMAEDIKVHGQKLPIILYEGKILDGRNRYTACTMAGIVPFFKELPGNEDPVAYAESMNVPRRHLTVSQLAMYADKKRDYYEAEAKKRMLAGKKSDPVETLPQGDTGKARDQVGKSVGVSGRTMDKAKKVREKGHKDLVKAVEAGKIDVTNAAKIAELPKDVQDTVLADAALNNWSGRQMVEEAKRLSGEPVKKAMSRPKNGLQYAKMAIVQLEKISPTDEQRVEAFELVMDWIKENQ
jgi:hypothetical protein